MCGFFGDADDDPQYVTCPPSPAPSFLVSPSPTEQGYTASPTIGSTTIVTATASMVMTGFGESHWGPQYKILYKIYFLISHNYSARGVATCIYPPLQTPLPFVHSLTFSVHHALDDPSEFTTDHETVFVEALVASVDTITSAEQVTDVNATAVSSRRTLRARDASRSSRSLLEDSSTGSIEVGFTLELLLEAYNYSYYSGQDENDFSESLLDQVLGTIHACDQPIDQSTNRPINQSTNRPIDQSTNRPIDQPIQGRSAHNQRIVSAQSPLYPDTRSPTRYPPLAPPTALDPPQITEELTEAITTSDDSASSSFMTEFATAAADEDNVDASVITVDESASTERVRSFVASSFNTKECPQQRAKGRGQRGIGA